MNCGLHYRCFIETRHKPTIVMFVMLSRSKLIDIQYLTLPIAKKGLRKERFVFKYFNDAEPQLFPKYIFSQLTDRIREEKKMKSKKIGS